MAHLGNRSASKTKSELLFEGYLRAHGHREFDFEPSIEGTTKRPDYRVHFQGRTVLLEVKEFRATAEELKARAGYFDPYPPLREKIDSARKKFQKLKEHCCALIVYNVNKPLVLLDWEHVYGAMLGNLGFSVPLRLPGRPDPEDDSVKGIFMSGGKMHRERDGDLLGVQNQTISAIIVLGRVGAGERLFHADLRRREHQQGRKFRTEEWFSELEKVRRTTRDPRFRPLRVVVHENPYARIPLPADLFCGLYDERYGELDGRVQLLYEGAELAALPSNR